MSKALVCALAASSAIAAQSPGELRRYNGNYHAFGVMGACQHGYGLFGGGGGAEALLWKGLSLGADASYVSFTDGWGFGMVSAQIGYHFVDRSKPLRLDPFVSFGPGALFGSGGRATGTGNFGGGVNYWFKPRIALRVEVRVHAAPEELMTTARIGLSFR